MRQPSITARVDLVILDAANEQQAAYGHGLADHLRRSVPLAAQLEADSSNTAEVLVYLAFSRRQMEQLAMAHIPTAAVQLVACALPESEFSTVAQSLLDALRLAGKTVIYSDDNRGGLIVPTEAKVTDTIFHKTVGPKYRSVRIGTDLQSCLATVPQREIADIIALGRFMQEHQLNPDTTAGAIAIRHSAGMLTTATATNKHEITPDRVCFVRGFDPDTDTVEWTGQAPPSSESPMSFRLFSDFPQSNVFLHFHCKPMTYSSELEGYRTARYVPYGTREEADGAVEILRATGDFAVLRGHGEIFLSGTVPELMQRVLAILAQVENKRPGASK